MSVTNKPALEAYVGSTGTGKGVSINRRLAELKPARLLIWDPRNEYGKFAPQAPTLPHVVGAFKHAKGGPVRVRYVPGADMDLGEAFGFICKVAFEAGNLVFLAEELSDVTTASHAPPAWRRISTQGRHAGLHVIGAAQRPALIDKTFLGACTRVRCFGLGYAEDRRAMSKELDVPEAALAELWTEEHPSGQTSIRYLEKFRRERITKAGLITINGARFKETATVYEPKPGRAT